MTGTHVLSLWLLLGQSTTYGQLTGVVRDTQGGVLPGAAVTLFGRDVLGEREASTELDGTYLFRALAPGLYNLRCELQGFEPVERRDVVVTTGTTITIHADLPVEGVSESVVVTGESPTVDVKTTRLGGTFDLRELQDVPSATDMWAVLAQSPGIRMRGFDIGGSHKAQQTGYDSYGVRSQNRIISDGVDSTEGTGGSGFYYDYYSVEEFQVSAGGADVEMTSPGASVVMTIKSGGNELSGLYHLDYEGESFVGDNSDAELEARGFTGNPNLLFWEAHADLGGPIVRDKAWFYAGYNHFTLDKQRSGVDRELATDKGIFDNYVAKLTLQLGERDRFIGYNQWGHKQAPLRGVSALNPPEHGTNQDGWTWVHKAEWQRLWSSRLFSNVQVKHFGYSALFLPIVDPATHPDRIDTATGVRSGADGRLPADTPLYKPHVGAQASYYLPSRRGGHDFKLGFDWQHDESILDARGSPLPVFYFDNSGLGRPHDVDEIRLASLPFRSNFVDRHFDVYAQDIWTVSHRLTLSLGVRVSRQRTFYDDAELEPVLSDFFPPRTVEGQGVVTWLNAAPRLGVSFDLTGEGKTVLKGYYGRFYENLAHTLSSANPVSASIKQFKFLDPNENGLYDGADELGDLVFEMGGGATNVNPDLTPAFSDEINLSVHHELAPDTSLRVSWVRKLPTNQFEEYNRAQVNVLLDAAVPCGDAIFPCPPDPFTGEPLRLVRVPDELAFAQDTAIDTFPGADFRYDTLQLAFERRFSGRFFVQGNIDYQWRHEMRAAFDDRGPLNTDPLGVRGFQNHHPDTPLFQDNTNWQGKLLARYVLPGDFAVSANLRHQSGFPWAPIHRVNIPGSGTQPFFLENIDENRSENVTLLDVRLEKSFQVSDRHRVSALLDVYNLTNSNAETNFALRTGSGYREIIAALDPRTFKIGIRWQF